LGGMQYRRGFPSNKGVQFPGAENGKVEQGGPTRQGQKGEAWREGERKGGLGLRKTKEPWGGQIPERACTTTGPPRRLKGGVVSEKSSPKRVVTRIMNTRSGKKKEIQSPPKRGSRPDEEGTIQTGRKEGKPGSGVG